LHGRRRRGGRHRDDRAFCEIGDQAIVAINHGIDFVRIADAKDHEVGLPGERRRPVGGRGTSRARILEGLALTSQAVTV